LLYGDIKYPYGKSAAWSNGGLESADAEPWEAAERLFVMHIINVFDRAVRSYSERIAFTGSGGDFTYKEAQSLSIRIAKALHNDGIGQGHNFAIFSPNSGIAMIAMLGGFRSGAAWSNINLRNTVEANIDILQRGECNALLYSQSATAAVKEIKAAVSSLMSCICIDGDDGFGTPFDEWVKDVDDSFVDYGIHETDVGLQGTTSGTTGLPKLTCNPHRFLLDSAIGLACSLSFDQPPVNLAVAPITHAGGLVVLGHFYFGGTTIMMGEVKLDEILETIESQQVTTLFLPPTIVYMLLAHPKVRDFDYSSLKYIIGGAAPFSPQKMAEAIDVFGPVLSQALGQSEAGFPLTFISPTETAEAAADDTKRHRLMSCGRPTSIIEAMEIMDEDDNILGNNKTGEIVLRAQGRMIGYKNDAKASAELIKDGWLHTGDVGYIDDDGYLYITDRIRDMIVSGGFNIFPYEIENVLMKVPGVQDCAVIGVPDAKWGEAVKAVVQLVPGTEMAEQELINLCKDELGSMKSPKSVDFIDYLPRSAVGKVLKKDLRKVYWKDEGRQVS